MAQKSKLDNKMAVALRRRFIHSPALTKRLLTFQWRSISISNSRKAEYNIDGENDFKETVIESKKPVVVDFHAVWCGPCKTLGPLLSKVVESRGGKVDLAKVNIDTHQDLALQYEVTAVPRVILMRGGEMVGSFLGLISEQEIEEFVPKE